MSKLSYVTGNLHRIGEQIAEASEHRHIPEEIGGKVRTEQSPETVESAPVADSKNDLAVPEKTFSPLTDRTGYFEIVNLRRDIQLYLEENFAAFSAESDRLKQRLAPVSSAAEKLSELRVRFNSLPGPDSVESAAFRNTIMEYERIRLESLRVCARAGKLRAKRRTAAGEESDEPSAFPLLSPGVLFRKGFFFFLPLILSLFVCTLLAGAAFVAAWKMAF